LSNVLDFATVSRTCCEFGRIY